MRPLVKQMIRLYCGVIALGALSTTILSPAVQASQARQDEAAHAFRLQSAPWGDISALRLLPARVIGRTLAEPLSGAVPLGARAYRHEWPGVYFETAFRGDAVTLRFADPHNEYRLFIDDAAPITLAQPGDVDVRLSNLGAGTHRIRVEKVTESIGLVGAFHGFYAARSVRPVVLAARPRQIAFYGDSNLTGYGLRSATRVCTQQQVQRLSDTQASYPAMVARRFGADFQVNAVSGRGMVRNYDGAVPDVPLPVISQRALFSSPGDWQDDSWQPQVIVVALGANDFSTVPRASERWPDLLAVLRDYEAGSIAFLTQLYQRNPAATIVMVMPFPMDLADPSRAEVAAGMQAVRQRIAAALHGAGLHQLLFADLAPTSLENSACDYHFSAQDHRRLESWLTGFLVDNAARLPPAWQSIGRQ